MHRQMIAEVNELLQHHGEPLSEGGAEGVFLVGWRAASRDAG